MAFYTYAVDPIGAFVEKETGNIFEYSCNLDGVIFPPAHGGKNTEFPHRVWVGGGDTGGNGYRYARVLKTVAHVVVDEDASGRAVIEKWHIKQNRKYAG